MILLFAMIYMIFIVIILTIVKNRINRIPVILYISWWGFLLIISMFNPYNLFPVSNRAYFLMLLDNLMFLLGYIIISFKKSTYGIKLLLDFKKIDRVIMYIQITILPVLIYYFVKYRNILNTLGHTYARKIKFEEGLLFTSIYESALYSYVLGPIILITAILVAIKIVQRDVKNITFILMIANIILNNLIGLGRFGYFQLIVFVIIAYLIVSENNKDVILLKKNKKGQRVIIIGVTFFLITLMSYTLLIRSGLENITLRDVIDGYYKLFEQAVIYFVGAFRAFDVFLHSGLEKTLGFYYGKLTFGGLQHLMGMFFRLFDRDYQIAYQTIIYITQEPITIGCKQIYNAFYTSLINYYLDFNIVGIIIFPLMDGIINAKVVNKFVENPNLFSLCLLVFFNYNSIASSLRWNYQFISTWIAMFILIAIYNLYEKRQTII